MVADAPLADRARQPANPIERNIIINQYDLGVSASLTGFDTTLSRPPRAGGRAWPRPLRSSTASPSAGASFKHGGLGLDLGYELVRQKGTADTKDLNFGASFKF